MFMIAVSRCKWSQTKAKLSHDHHPVNASIISVFRHIMFFFLSGQVIHVGKVWRLTRAKTETLSQFSLRGWSKCSIWGSRSHFGRKHCIVCWSTEPMVDWAAIATTGVSSETLAVYALNRRWAFPLFLNSLCSAASVTFSSTAGFWQRQRASAGSVL